MTENQQAAEQAFDSTILNGSPVTENPISDAAFDAPPVPEAPETAPEAKQEAKADKPPSTRDAIEKALDEAEGKGKAEAKEEPKLEAKAEKTEPAKATEEEAKAEKGAAEKPASEREEAEPRQSEGRKYPEPPARFLPEARTKWSNVPNEIKSEFHRVTEEYEREVTQHRQFREELREYEDLAKQHGVTLKDTMARYVAADRALNQSFGHGVAQIAQMYGRNPAQAIAEVMQGFGITPQQYIQAVTQNPQLAQVTPPQLQQQQQRAPEPKQPQIDPQQMVAQVKEQLRLEMTAEQTVAKFASEHPDFAEHADRIKRILDNKAVEALYGDGLTLEQKLAEAYRMAGGGSSPSIQAPAAPVAHSESDARPVNPDAGTKSIRGAPTAGTDTQNKRFKSNRDAAAAALGRAWHLALRGIKVAPVVTDRNLRQALTASMFSRSPGVQDLVYNFLPITAALRERGAIRAYDGGPEIRVPLMIDKLSAQWFTGYDKLNIQPKELVNSAVFTPKRVTSMFSLTGTELLYNQGRARIIDLMQLYLDASQEGIREEMEAALVGDGTGTGGREMIGLGGALPIVANAGVYGGIDRAQHAIWRTTTYSVPGGDFFDIGTTWDSTTARQILSRIALTRSKGSRYGKLAIASPDAYAAIEDSMVAHQRIVNSNGAVGRLGFRALEVMTGVGPIEVVAAGGVGSVMPANTIYILDLEGLELVYHPQNNFVPMHDGDGAKPVNQDAIAQGYVWTGELIMRNPRYQVRLITGT